MTTELLLRAGTATWQEVAASIEAAIGDLLDGRITGVSVAAQDDGARVDGHRTADLAGRDGGATIGCRGMGDVVLEKLRAG